MAAMAAVTLALIGFFSFLMIQMTAPQMVPLFTDLSVEDSASIVKDLDRQAIPYEIKSDGAIVMVSKDKVARLRMKLAEGGLPKGGGVGYEIFDKSDALGATSFIQNINHLRALEGELARTIRSIDRVQAARVHLVLPERPLFSRDKADASASIVLKMRGTLEPQQVRAIRHLVATAVNGLKPERVSVIDEPGKLLADGAAQDNPLEGAGADERKMAFENRLRNQVEGIVSSVVGPGHARVQLTADFDFNRITQTSDKFDPDGRVLRSSQTREEQSSTGDGKEAGAVSVGTDRLTEQIKALRRSLAVEMGFVMPAVRILDNVQLDANAYVIKVKEVEAGSGKVWSGQYMVMDPAGGQVKLPGTHTTEPIFGLPATWIDAAIKEEASMKGYTVVDAATVLSTHLTELLKNNMAELLSYGEVQKLLKDLPKEQAELLKDLVPSLITVSGIQRVLQILLAERVSIRDLSTILEGIADGIGGSRNPVTLAEHVRARIQRQICAQHTSQGGYLPLIAMSAKWEQAFAESMVGQGEDRQLAMQPSKLSEFITLVREKFEAAAREGEAPVLVTSAGIRPFVRGIVERFRAQTPVMSQSEIHPRARLKTVASI